jgi:hypothetical protein
MLLKLLNEGEIEEEEEQLRQGEENEINVEE